MKKISIFILVFIFFIFCYYQMRKSNYYYVLKVITPTKIVVDFNNNGFAEPDETVIISVKSFSEKPSKAQAELAHSINISDENAMAFGYLAQKFADVTLCGKSVRVNNKHNNIFIDNKNYSKMLISHGFAFSNSEAISSLFWQNLKSAQALHLVIFNNKSHKYHKLNCKYGLMAHNSQLIPRSQLPHDAHACKFCFSKYNYKNKKFQKKYKKYFSDKISWYTELIPNIPQPSLTFKSYPIAVYLTDYTRIPKLTSSCSSNICKALVNEINSAQSSIDFAIYGYTKVPKIQQALVNAQARGVNIRFVYDTDCKGQNSLYPDTSILTKLFIYNNYDNSSAFMHNKFFIFDNKKVFTGSANLSNTDMSGFNSNSAIVINSEYVAKIYKQEFEQMYEGKFHRKKHKIKKSSDIAVYFSPKDRPLSTYVVPLIDSASKYIYIPAFLVSQKDMVNSLINAHKRGVDVKIILDATNTHGSYSKLKYLRQSGIQVKTEVFAGKLHSKTMIIDDFYTIIGSMNFSQSGQSSNDENLVILQNKELAIFYKNFFLYLWKRIPDKWLKYNARAEAPESVGSCSDGLDNDFDGKIDKADSSCKIPVYKKSLKTRHR